MGDFLDKKRNTLSIVAAILEAATLETNKTRIMFQANLSFKLLSKYLGAALESGLIQVNGDKYLLADRGKAFLKQYKNLKERQVGAQKLLDSLDSEYHQLYHSYITNNCYVLIRSRPTKRNSFETKVL